MSLPQERRHDDHELERYVLGLLPPATSERLDEDSIVDDEIAARLRIVEDDLIEGYVRGTLEKDIRERFESFYLASAHRRRNVNFSAELLRAVDVAVKRADELGALPPGTKNGEMRAAVGHSSDELITVRPRFRLDLAAIATLALVACAALLLLAIRSNAPRQADNAPVPSSAPTVEATPTGETARAEKPLPAEAPAPDAPAPADRSRRASELPTVALVLMPQTRALAPVPALAIPPGTERVQFELQLESNDFPRYQVALRDPATNQIVWRGAWSAAKTSPDEYVSVSVPATLLKPQHYSLDLSGRDEAGGAEVVGSYAFRIVPR